MTIKITVSENAFESMVLATCEAYEFGNASEYGYVETYAHLWGYRRRNKRIEHVHIDRIHICVSAEGTYKSVSIDDDDEKLVAMQAKIVEHLSPRVSFLGNFHTHPYDDRQEVDCSKGWGFSKKDKDWFRSFKDLWRYSKNKPIFLVMTIAKLKRVRKSKAEQEASFRWKFTIGEYQIYLTAAVGRLEKGKERKRRTFIQNRDVQLVLVQDFPNYARSRMGPRE